MAAWLTPAQARERAPIGLDVPDGQVERAVQAASDVLAGLSGLRPAEQVLAVAESCGCGTLITGPHSRVDVGAAGTAGGSPFHWRVGADLMLSQGTGGCHHELLLPDNPVVSVQSVHVGGTLLEADTYELADGNRLRLTGRAWTSPVRVSYTTGSLPEVALRAAAVLASELVKAEMGDRTCQLPARVQTVTRQGVTFALLDPQAFLDGGRTGLYIVDLFLASTRKPRRSVAVTSPDVPSFHRLRG